MLLNLKPILVLTVLFVVTTSLVQAGQSFYTLNVYVADFTFPDRREGTEIHQNLTTEFHKQLVNNGCFKSVLERRNWDELKYHKKGEQEFRKREKEELSENTKKLLSTKGADAVIFGQIRVSSFQYVVDVTVKSFSGESLAQENIELPSLTRNSSEIMKELVKKLCLLNQKNLLCKDLGDFTKIVKDKYEGLMWLDDIDSRSWTEREQYAELANQCMAGGYDDWRLPSILELQALANSPEKGNFKSRNRGLFWSSKKYEFPGCISCEAWLVNMHSGRTEKADVKDKNYVRLVRSI